MARRRLNAVRDLVELALAFGDRGVVPEAAFVSESSNVDEQQRPLPCR
jgi:hypothetical protein